MAVLPSPADVDRRRLVFRVGEQSHEIEAGLVIEVMRVPYITRVPHGPEALAGIANLRGKPVPVLSMGKVLNGSHNARPDGKIIVYDHGGAVGLLVDDVLRLSADATAAPLQDLNGLLDAAFKVTRRSPSERTAHGDRGKEVEASAQLIALLSFRVAGQLYGLPLDDIREVAMLTGDIAVIPNAASAVVGLIPMRDSVLPLVSLASLLGLEGVHSAVEGSRIIVVEHEGDLVGLVVDGMDVIRRLPEDAIGTVPAVLQRGRGDAHIEAIGRIADGGLLISILSPQKLFGHHAVTQAIGQNTGAKPMGTTRERQETVEQFLIFQLGDENYGLPIGSVDEVVRVPSEVTRMPRAPAFVMGVINLRGKAIPLIDQRTRFDTLALAQMAKARAIIVTLGTLQAGFVVDGVSEVKAVSSAALSAAPEFSSDRTEVFDRIAHIESDGRMILLVDPKELLSRAERDIVAAITEDKPAVAVP
ncbi:chemotaxis protein [Agrobacterium vitis]|uniref:chemotaxis protein CheW n=1 Tax=Rhizobium/Agrobacterium group TaxID=227290 RepID=UPI0012E929BB|nr:MULTISPECIES: chemotaxis protein CheW [Rhizobium/Agrobacterium group]MCF1475373.1 chemotaxis protein [Allorhizobium ampelinum]MVA74389.1 chemotaxis protein [Agrobacterium vitis]